jgi:hypothetical protein
MKVSTRFLMAGLAAASIAAAVAPAGAFENLAKGKSPSELFNTNCRICHRNPQELRLETGASGLARFLSEHYTSSRTIADTLAGYLMSVNRGARAPATKRPRSRTAAPAKKPN